MVFRVHGHLLCELTRFASVYAGAFAFNLAVLPLGVELAGISVLLVQAAVVVITVVSSFFLQRGFSLKAGHGHGRRRPEADACLALTSSHRGYHQQRPKRQHAAVDDRTCP